MKAKLNRRDFFTKSAKAGVAGCALLMGMKLSAMEEEIGILMGDEPPDPKKLNYCGYKCPEDCPFKKATLENDEELKKECYKNWGLKERFDVEFDPETMFCYGCKTEDKPLGFVVKTCSVRNCAIKKGYDCCIECDALKSCDKDLWTRFPDFYKAVKEMQQKYLAAKG